MKRFSSESGQTLIFVALGMTVLLGMVGFATDVGVLLHERREAQTAADSAAIAGALEALAEGQATSIDSSITSAAKGDAALNGFTDGSNGATVTVAMAPNITISTFNTAGYVQATVTQNTPDFFMKLFGYNSMNVSATAIATELGEVAPCMNVQNDGNANPAVYMSGNSLIAAAKCGIPVNGNIQFNGGKATINAGFVAAEGTISGNAGVGINGPYAQRVPPAPNPMAVRLSNPSNEPTVSSGSCTSPDGTTCYYDYGLNAKGAYQQGVTGTATIGATTLPAGIYYYDIPVAFNIPASGTLTGTGVTFYLAGTNSFDFSGGNGTISLSGPTTGTTYQNVLIDAPTDGPYTVCKTGKGNNNSPAAGELYFDFGSSNTTLTGIVYAPAAELFVQDSGATMKFSTDLVIGNVCMQSATFSISGLAAPAASTKVGLVY